jgi:glycerol dehydrogenase
MPRATFAEFGGECTAEEITRLADEARRGRASSIVGVGGGKAIDTAKGVARELSATLVIVPTVASNDSPTSRLAVVYERNVLEVRLMAQPGCGRRRHVRDRPRAGRYFVSGIGDALSKKFGPTPASTRAVSTYKARLLLCRLTLADVRRGDPQSRRLRSLRWRGE